MAIDYEPVGRAPEEFQLILRKKGGSHVETPEFQERTLEEREVTLLRPSSPMLGRRETS